MSETAFLIGLLVLLCLGFSALAIVGAWLVWGRATQAARYDLDAAAQALKMQGIIDASVARRITTMRFLVDKEGNLIDAEGKVEDGTRRARFSMQPPDPNVRQTTRVDEIHELERETNRVTGDAEFSTRDNFSAAGYPNNGSMASSQPPPPMET